MGKVLYLPGIDPDPPTRSELVDSATDIVLKSVIDVFIEQKMEPGRLENWHRAIRDYFWRQEIKLTRRTFREDDLRRWKAYWRDQALREISSRRPR